jgi:hypothetical protein
MATQISGNSYLTMTRSELIKNVRNASAGKDSCVSTLNQEDINNVPGKKINTEFAFASGPVPSTGKGFFSSALNKLRNLF